MKKFFNDHFLLYFLPILVLFAFVYAFFATQGTFHFFEYRQGIYNNWLATIFLSGRTGVPIEAKEAVPLADGSIYHGMLYLYWGPVPALLHAAWKLIFHSTIYTSVLIYIFSLTNLCLVWLILSRILRRLFGAVDVLTLYALILPYGFGPMLFSVTRSFVYEEAVILGSTFLLWTIFLSLNLPNRYRSWRLILIGLLFSLAIATRFNLIFFAPLILGYIWIELRPGESIGSLWRSFMTASIPIIVTLSLIGYYNYARFGRITEFGVTYQNASVASDLQRIKNGQTMSWQYIPYNFAHYFLKPVYFTMSGHISGLALPGTIGSFPKLSRVESTASVFAFSPILILAIWSLRSKRLTVASRSFLRTTQIGLGIFLVFGLLSYVGNGYRYIQDFLPLLLFLAAPILASYFIPNSHKARRWAYVLVGVVTIYGILISLEQVCGAYFGGFACLKIRTISEFILFS